MLRKEIMNKLVVDLLQQKGMGCWKILQKRCKQGGGVSSAHKLDGLGKVKEHAPRSEHVHLASPGHWSHTQEPSSSHAAASTFKVCARKWNLLALHITCLDRSRWRYRGTLIGIRSFLEKGVANQEWCGQFVVVRVGVHQLSVPPNTSHPMLQICSKLLHGNSTPSLNS